MQRALITGIGGQDGSHPAELLLGKGYEVHGIVRRASSFNTGRLDHIYQDPHESGPRLQLHYGDLTDSVALVNLIRSVAPSEVYHLGAQSHVKVSFEIPEYTGESTGLGTIRLLAVKPLPLALRFTARLRRWPSSVADGFPVGHLVPLMVTESPASTLRGVTLNRALQTTPGRCARTPGTGSPCPTP